MGLDPPTLKAQPSAVQPFRTFRCLKQSCEFRMGSHSCMWELRLVW